MYQRSPMENFNKNNPFIVVAKRKYDKIVDDIQLFGKNCIRLSIISFALWIGILICQIYLLYMKSNTNILISIPVLTLIVNLGAIYCYRRKIAYFISLHPNMQEFDRISSLEVNDILSLNNENVLKCVHGLYELNGELTATKKYYDLFQKVYVIVELALIITLGIFINY